MANRGTALIWLLLLLALVAWLAVRMSTGPVINANLMSLLPTVERDLAVEDAADTFRQRFERRVVLLIGAGDATAAKSAATLVRNKLEASEAFAGIDAYDGGDLIQQAGKFYFPLRFNLLSNAARAQLAAGEEAEFERAVLARYFNPVSGLRSDLIERDPLHLLSSFLEERAAANVGAFEMEDGFLLLRGEDQTFVLLTGELNDSPFSFDLQDRLAPVMAGLSEQAPSKAADVTILKAGVFFHAAAGTANAKDEISTVGVGALIGIVLLFALVFRSWRPLTLSLFSIAVGCLGGFVICLALFGQVHLLTLVFGASLIGISVDYSLHYFCEHLRQGEDWSPQAALRHVLPGISLGLVTSVIGFAGLLFASFPGMQQMAIFSGAGLIFAYICVLTIYPLFGKAIKTNHMARPLIWSAAYANFCRKLWGPKAWAVIAALLIVSAIGMAQLQPQDDIRQLQSADVTVSDEQRQMRDLLGDDLASQFFLVSGKDQAELLAREERLIGALRQLQREGHISGYIGLSEFVPSAHRLADNHQLLSPLMAGDNSLLHRVAARIGLSDAVVENYGAAFDQAQPANPTLLANWLDSPLAKPYRHLWLGAYGEQIISVVGLRGVSPGATLRQLADAGQGVSYIDNVGELSAVFGDIRRQAGWLILISYAFVSALMLFRYGLRGGVAVMTAPIVAATTSLGIQGLIGEPLNLFNVLAILLVLGIGVDYGIFFRETGAGNPSTLVAITLSSITTLLAFGLLALSATTAVHAFGLTILLGIGVALLLSPLAGAGKSTGEARA